MAALTPRSVLARIDDMLGSIEIIERISRGEAGASSPPDIQDMAVERAIEIVSEASRHIPDELKATEPDIRWRTIAGIGNVLRHDYQLVRRDIIANAIELDVPILKAALLRMIKAIEAIKALPPQAPPTD